MDFYDDASFYANKAFEFLDKGDKENAIANAKIATRIRRRDPNVHLDLGNIYFGFKDYKKAIKCYKRAIRRKIILATRVLMFGTKWEYRQAQANNNVKNFKAYGWMGKAYREIGDFDKARKAFNTAIRYAEKNKDWESVNLINSEIVILENQQKQSS